MRVALGGGDERGEELRELLGVVAEFADRALVMYAGRAVETASVTDLYADRRMPYTAGLLGSVPRLAAARGERLVPIPGAPPSLESLSVPEPVTASATVTGCDSLLGAGGRRSCPLCTCGDDAGFGSRIRIAPTSQKLRVDSSCASRAMAAVS